MVRILTPAERDRLVELIDIQNTATQVDRHESAELSRLWGALFEEAPVAPKPLDTQAVLTEIAGAIGQVHMEFGMDIDGRRVDGADVDSEEGAVRLYLSDGQVLYLLPTVTLPSEED